MIALKFYHGIRWNEMCNIIITEVIKYTYRSRGNGYKNVLNTCINESKFLSVCARDKCNYSYIVLLYAHNYILFTYNP